MKSVSNLKIKVFADGADRAGILEMYANPLIKGFTTNPTLMRKAGVTEYRAFASEILAIVKDRPVSFEVFADEFGEMEVQALEISSWAKNVVVKIPVTNTRGYSSANLLHRLASLGVKVNVTALTTLEQVQGICDSLRNGPPCYVSVFAGRIADTGRDPVPIMAEAVKVLRKAPQTELIWASPRELLNIFQAEAIGCQVITATTEILKKLPLVGKDLAEYSLETVKMFHGDALRAGYRLSTDVVVK